jgi:LPS export ABC transporter protein LptC
MGCFFMVSCENDAKAVDELFAQKTGVEEAENIIAYYSQNSFVKAKLTAPHMYRYLTDSPYVEFSRSLHVDFFKDSAIIESTLDAKYARYKEKDGLVLLKDSVVVINLLSMDTLKTSELWWDQNTEEFYTHRPVWVHQPGKQIYGANGIIASQNFDSYTFFGARGRVESGAEKMLE